MTISQRELAAKASDHKSADRANVDSAAIGVSVATDFLRQFDPIGRHNLVAIDPETGAIHGRTFGYGQWAAIEAWIQKRWGKFNLYFSVNEPIAEAPHKKLDKAHVGTIRAVYVDIDPDKAAETMPGGFEAERRRITVLVKTEETHWEPPAFTIDSGGGMQMFWKLAPALDATDPENVEWAEGMGRTLKARFDGDSVENIDRVMRLPGTVNLPNATKRNLGRKPANATLRTVGADGALSRKSIEDRFGPPTAKTSTTKATGTNLAEVMADIDMSAVLEQAAYDDLPAELRRRFVDLWAKNPSVKSLWDGDRSARPGPDASGSGFAWALAAALRHTGDFSPTEFGQLLFVWNYSSDPEKLTARDIARAWVRSKAASAEEEFEAVDVVDRQSKATPTKAKKLHHILQPDVTLDSDSVALIDGWYDYGSMVVTYGESEAGKTHVVLSQAFAIATGQPWAGLETRQGLVVYVAAEGGRGIKKRVVAWRNKVGETNRFALVPCRVDLLRPSGDIKELIEEIQMIEAEVDERAAMIVIDTLSRALAGGNENSPEDMGALVMHCDRIRETTGATLHVIHHSGKNLAAGARGHSLLKAATDTEIEVDKAAHKITVTKQRDMEHAKPLGFTLEQVKVGVDKRGRDITAAVPVIAAVNEFESKVTGQELGAYRSLKRLVMLRAGIDPQNPDFLDDGMCDKADITSQMAAVKIRTGEWRKALKPRQGEPSSPKTIDRLFDSLAGQEFVIRCGKAKRNEILWQLTPRQPRQTPSTQPMTN